MDVLEWEIDEQQQLQNGPLTGWQLRACFPNQSPGSPLWDAVQKALGGEVCWARFEREGSDWFVVARPAAAGARGVCARSGHAPLSPEPLLAAYGAQGRIIRAVAHNLNNQLGAICNYTALLRQQHDELPREIDAIESLAFKASDQLSELRILGTSQQQLHIEPLETSTWLATTLARARIEHPDRTFTVAEDGAHIPADVEVLDLAMQAALRNAVEATASGDQINLSAWVAPLDADALSGWSARPGQYWHLRITDTGEGIPAERLEPALQVFEGTRSPSRGVGLPTILSIARLHGGMVLLESAPGAGTVLTLSLPLLSPTSSARPARSTPQPAAPPAAVGTLLLADDNRGVLMVTSKTLQRAGYTVDTAPNGDDALTLFQADPDRYAAALVDDRMPGRSGLALAAAMRAIRPHLRILLITGGAKPAGCPYPVLNKPYRPNQLLTMVETLLH